MSAADVRRAEKPHLRKINGYWRVSAVPVKWHRLCARLQNRWKRAHSFADEKNREKLG